VSGHPSALQVVAAVLLPPLGIFLAHGLGSTFWIGTLLTVIGWVPGMVFALVALFRPTLVTRSAA
jgi:uncharacterized membrane protein YqaE (UPF0057 family)